MLARLAAWCACVALVAGCQAGVVPVVPTEALPPATPIPATVAVPTPVVPTSIPRALLPPTPFPTLQPTLQPTQWPTTAATVPPVLPTATPTPDATRVVQQRYCDAAAPPAHLPLPPIATFIRITPADDPTRSIPTSGGPLRADTQPAPHVTAAHVVVLDEASGAVLHAVDPFSRQAPASITKIATTIVALEYEPDIKKLVTTTVSSSALAACDGSSVMGLEPNDHVMLETLLFGMMLPSGNDAAEQVAYSLAGSRDTYVAWMNAEVAQLHLRDTHFVTPSGMDADDHYSSAYDMAVLARYAMQNPEFRKLVSTMRFVGDDYYMHNLNPLLGTYDGADGVKIGYTDIAGRTIVASATREGHRVYVSLLGSRNLMGDCAALFDWVWQTFRW